MENNPIFLILLKYIFQYKKDYKQKNTELGMTILIGMNYENKKGALIVSDSRMSIGTNYYSVKKVEDINKVFIATAGYMAFGDELKEYVKEFSSKNKNLMKENKSKIIREAIQKIHKQVVGGDEEEEESKYENKCEGILGFYTNKPEIYNFSEGSLINRIRTFRAVGATEDMTEGILNKFYQPNITRQQAIDLSVYCIMESSKNNLCVDDIPQIAIIEKRGCRILNDSKESEQFYDSPYILEVKKRMSDFSEKQKVLFDILTSENEEKKNKLSKILRTKN